MQVRAGSNMNPYFLSTHTKTSIKDGIIAVFNTLKMRPIYAINSEFDKIFKLLQNGIYEDSSSWLKYKDIFEQLRESRIITHGDSEDRSVLERARHRLNPPFPHLLYLVITDKCNMACEYCFVKYNRSSKYKEKIMSNDTAKKALDFFSTEIRRNNEDDFKKEKQIIFYGGEPLLNFPVIKFSVEYIELLKEKGYLTPNTVLSIVTNGTLLSTNIANFFRANKISMGISLDGDKIVTNQNRPLKTGGSAYEKILHAISICQETGVKVGLSITITPIGLERKDLILEQILSLNVSSIGFNIMIGNKKEVQSDFYRSTANFLLEAFQVLRSKGIYEDRLMRKTQAFVDSQLYLYDCAAAGGNQIVIAPDGDVGICHGFISDRQYFYGNIHNNIDRSKYDKIYDEWCHRTPIFMEECLDCTALSICGGGCPFNAFINTGSIWGKDERFCEHAKATLDWLIWDLYKNTTNTL